MTERKTSNNKDMCKRTKKDRHNYKHLEVSVPQSYKTYTTNDVYPKECYGQCIDYIWENDFENMILVHGYYLFKGCVRIDHAWVEIDNVLFDGVYQRFYDKEVYYKEFGLVKQLEFTRDQALEIATETDWSGPWWPQQLEKLFGKDFIKLL